MFKSKDIQEHLKIFFTLKTWEILFIFSKGFKTEVFSLVYIYSTSKKKTRKYSKLNDVSVLFLEYLGKKGPSQYLDKSYCAQKSGTFPFDPQLLQNWLKPSSVCIRSCIYIFAETIHNSTRFALEPIIFGQIDIDRPTAVSDIILEGKWMRGVEVCS